jgi:hypothetical protein
LTNGTNARAHWCRSASEESLDCERPDCSRRAFAQTRIVIRHDSSKQATQWEALRGDWISTPSR